MTPAALYADLARRGVILTVQDGRLKVDAPAGILTAADKSLLAQHKAELLCLLAGRQALSVTGREQSTGVGGEAILPASAAQGQGTGPGDSVADVVAGLGLTFNTAADRAEAVDWLVAFEERAGIMEFDGNLYREEAERLAGLDCGLSPTVFALLERLNRENN